MPGASENDNAMMAQVYNAVDRYADRLGCAFLIVHHISKGSQADKAVTDVGSGAGAQSRACDAHIVLRQHEEDGCAELEAAVRSWPPVEPIGLRWDYPIWHPGDTLDTTALRQGGKRRRPKAPDPDPKPEPAVVWDVDKFVANFLSAEPRTEDAILVAADGMDLSDRKARRLLATAVEREKAHRWAFPGRQKAKFATVEQPVTATVGEP